MTHLLAIDPGDNTGIALGEYDDETPWTLVERWQVHGGTTGFRRWWSETDMNVDEIVCESFEFRKNDFAPDYTPLRLEGVLEVLLDDLIAPTFQPPSDKGGLIGYSPEADTPDRRQRERYDWLDGRGLFVPGTENDDTNDAITHALIYMRRRQHIPTMLRYWPPRRRR